MRISSLQCSESASSIPSYSFHASVLPFLFYSNQLFTGHKIFGFLGKGCSVYKKEDEVSNIGRKNMNETEERRKFLSLFSWLWAFNGCSLITWLLFKVLSELSVKSLIDDCYVCTERRPRKNSIILSVHHLQPVFFLPLSLSPDNPSCNTLSLSSSYIHPSSLFSISNFFYFFPFSSNWTGRERRDTSRLDHRQEEEATRISSEGQK